MLKRTEVSVINFGVRWKSYRFRGGYICRKFSSTAEDSSHCISISESMEWSMCFDIGEQRIEFASSSFGCSCEGRAREASRYRTECGLHKGFREEYTSPSGCRLPAYQIALVSNHHTPAISAAKIACRLKGIPRRFKVRSPFAFAASGRSSAHIQGPRE
jgi:hypothetical protein